MKRASFSLFLFVILAQGVPPLVQTAGPELLIDWNGPQYPISPYIYGINYWDMTPADEDFAVEIKLPVCRWGGNAATTYNWEIDVINTAADWFFENHPQTGIPGEVLPNGSRFDQFVLRNRRLGSESLGTLPMIGWTPKARTYDCSFSVAKYGPQQRVDPWNPNCGNGVKPDGRTYIVNDPTDAYKKVGPDFIAAWVQHLVGRFGTADGGGVKFYNLDNEPDWWFRVHRDIHPAPYTYDELRDLTYQYAAAVKAVDPSAQLLGPTVGGWWSAFYSATDWVAGWSTPPWQWDSNPVDRRAHGDVPLVEWYLQQMRDYEQQHGVRLVDYLDVHGYIHPDLNSAFFKNISEEQKRAIRLESTRALWDPTYEVPGSGYKDKPRFIRRMHEWVDRNYPGTKLAITEYNWGGLNELNGALTLADILGIFGRERLDLAAIWDPPKPDEPGAFAFRIYRNYDGQGGMFGDVAVSADSADQSKIAIYAARRSSDNALTLVIINKTTTDLISHVQLSGASFTGKAQVYRYSSANLKAIVREAGQDLRPTGFTATFPAYSITMIVASVAPELIPS